MSREGFHFYFGPDEDIEVRSAGARTTFLEVPVEAGPTVSLDELPIYVLSPELLAEWAGSFPKSRNDKMELCINTLPCPLTLIYQKAPRVVELTTYDRQEQRDIIPGKYYGGLKVWSCAPYLVKYMFANRSMFTSFFSSSDGLRCGETANVGKNPSLHPVVVEVGCGQGLPGIAALILGARHVIFQDYNEEVHRLCVVPNIGINFAPNCEGATVLQKNHNSFPVVQLASGDWNAMTWHDSKDDTKATARVRRSMVLLGSDVTFDDEACAKLALLVARLLFVNGGVAFIASKRYYFGTNGGALEFQKRCEECGLTVHEASRSDMEGGMQHVILRIECLDLGGMLGKEIAVQQR